LEIAQTRSPQALGKRYAFPTATTAPATTRDSATLDPSREREDPTAHESDHPKTRRTTASLRSDKRSDSSGTSGHFRRNRHPLPLLRDLAFHLQLYRAALEEPWVVDLEDRAAELGLVTCGLDTPVVCSADRGNLPGWASRTGLMLLLP
jgi:hypothetical protein